MSNYKITTQKSWSATTRELDEQFRLWGVTNWDTNYPRGARLEGFNQTEQDRTVTLKFTKNEKQVSLSMAKQNRAVDNLRVLYLAVEAMRLNEKRGVGELLESAYLQIAGPEAEKLPHEILGISEDSAIEVAEAAFRTMASKYHPDKKPSGDTERFKAINKAIQDIRKKHNEQKS